MAERALELMCRAGDRAGRVRQAARRAGRGPGVDRRVPGPHRAGPAAGAQDGLADGHRRQQGRAHRDPGHQDRHAGDGRVGHRQGDPGARRAAASARTSRWPSCGRRRARCAWPTARTRCTGCRWRSGSSSGICDGVSDFDVFLADCPARTTLEVVGHTWSVVVVVALGNGPLRYGELLDRIGGISNKMLTQTLTRLRGNGLLTSARRPARPDRPRPFTAHARPRTRRVGRGAHRRPARRQAARQCARRDAPRPNPTPTATDPDRTGDQPMAAEPQAASARHPAAHLGVRQHAARTRAAG